MAESNNATLLKVLTGLDKEDLKVYAQILRHGFATTSYIAEYSGVKEKKVIEILETLGNKNLVKSIPGSVPRWIPLKPYSEMLKYIENFHNEVNTIQNQFKEFDTQREVHFVKVVDTMTTQISELLSQASQSIKDSETKIHEETKASVNKIDGTITQTAKEIPITLQNALAGVDTTFQKDTNAIAQSLTTTAKQSFQETENACKDHLQGMNQAKIELQKQIHSQVQVIDTEVSNVIASETAQIEQQVQSFNTTIAEQLAKFISELVQTKKMSQEQIQTVLNSMMSALTKTIATSESQWNSFKQDVSAKLGETSAQVGQELKTFKESTNQNITQANQQFNSDFGTLVQTTQNALSDMKKQYIESSSQWMALTDTSMKQLIQLNITNSTNFEKRVQKAIQQQHQEATEVNTKYAEKLNTSVNNIIGTHIDTLNKVTGNLKDIAYNATTKEVTRFKTDAKAALGQNQQAYMLKMQQASDSFQNSFKSQINGFLVEVDAEVKKSNKENKDPEAQALLNLGITKFKEITEKFKKELNENIAKEALKLQSEIKNSLEDKATKYILEIEGQAEIYQRTFRDEIAATTANLIKEFDGIKTQYKADSQAFLTTSTAGLQQSRDKLSADSTQNKTGWVTSVQKDFDGVRASLNESNQNAQTQMNTQIQNVTENVKNQITQTSNQLQVGLKALNDQTANLIMEKVVGVQKQLTEAPNAYFTRFDAQLKELHQTLGQQFNTSTAQISQSSDSTILIPEKNSEVMAKIVTDSKSKIDAAVKQLKATFMATISESTNKWDTLSNQLDSSIVQKITATQQEFGTLLENILKQIDGCRSNMESKFTGAITLTNTTADQTLAQINTQLKTDLDNMIKSVDAGHRAVAESLNNTTKSLSDKTKDQVNQTQQALHTKTTELFNKETELINNGYTASGKPALILKDSWNTVLQSNLIPIEKTWLIAGREPISTYLSELINRTKKSLRIVVPDFDSLDLKDLMEREKKGVAVTIISNLDTAKKNKPDKASEKGIKVLHNPDIAITMAIRDELEECIFAPIAQNIPGSPINPQLDELKELTPEGQKVPQDAVGIVSNLESFVRKIGQFLDWNEKEAKPFAK